MMDGDLPAKPQTPSLEAALNDAHPPSLLMALVQLTGDTRWLDGERPAYTPFDDGQGGFSEAFRERIKQAVLDAVTAYRDGRPAPPAPDEATVRRMMDFIAGEPIPAHYAPFLQEELAIDGLDAKRPLWDEPRLAEAAASLKTTIIGAGMSGLLTAIRLKQAGVPFEIIEKNSDVGGTWFENIYPGCRVDTPNHLYSYSFEPNHDWPARYSTQDVLLAYFQRTAQKHDLRRHIRFDTQVIKTTWNAAQSLWLTDVRDKLGTVSVIKSAVVISAVGQLNQPRTPDIPGQDQFEGQSFHSARWPQGFEADAKSIAVIGAGASAFQFVPKIAPEAAALTVFQRSPSWLAPTADYHAPVPEGKKALLEHVPFYDRWYRFFLFWTTTDGVYEAVKADPDWTGGPGAVGQANAELRKMLVEVLKPQTQGREDLLAKVTPDYPFGGKRPLRDNGVWIEALRRDNVDLVTEPILRITPKGVLTDDGVEHPADVLIYATGFHASSYLKGIEVVGEDAKTLHEVWDGDARAYLGMTIPGFPNFFSLYGPNTNIVVNGSIIFFSECSVRYLLGCLELLARSGSKSLSVKPEVFEAFNARVDAANAKMAWGASHVKSWYKNETGRVSQNWPFPLVDYWTVTRRPDPADFILQSSGLG